MFPKLGNLLEKKQKKRSARTKGKVQFCGPRVNVLIIWVTILTKCRRWSASARPPNSILGPASIYLQVVLIFGSGLQEDPGSRSWHPDVIHLQVLLICWRGLHSIPNLEARIHTLHTCRLYWYWRRAEARRAEHEILPYNRCVVSTYTVPQLKSLALHKHLVRI